MISYSLALRNRRNRNISIYLHGIKKQKEIKQDKINKQNIAKLKIRRKIQYTKY